MRYKAVPPTPPSEVGDADEPTGPAGILATVRDALPLVPRPEDDCCARLVDRVDWIDDRDAATEWIVFLRALGLAERSDAGYSRVRDEIDREAVAAGFQTNVLGAAEVLDALDGADDPLTTATCFEVVEPIVPEWERQRNDAWREEWQSHVERLLAWATILGLAEEQADGFVRA